ncbi:MAG: ACT domain-containing protein [Acutalibacteraceae bacterium]
MDKISDNVKLIVDSEVLPEIFIKVLQVKESLNNGDEVSASIACKKAGISRSAYYKYKNHINVYEDTGGKVVTLHAVLADKAGILSMFMSVLYESGANILTVNQNIPSEKKAPVSVSFRTVNADFSVSGLINQLKEIEGVKSVHQVFGD